MHWVRFEWVSIGTKRFDHIYSRRRSTETAATTTRAPTKNARQSASVKSTSIQHAYTIAMNCVISNTARYLKKKQKGTKKKRKNGMKKRKQLKLIPANTTKFRQCAFAYCPTKKNQSNQLCIVCKHGPDYAGAGGRLTDRVLFAMLVARRCTCLSAVLFHHNILERAIVRPPSCSQSREPARTHRRPVRFAVLNACIIINYSCLIILYICLEMSFIDLFGVWGLIA